MKKRNWSIAGRKLALLPVVVLLSFVNASAVEFKGVELGQPLWIADEKAAFGKLDCNPMQMSAEEYQDYMVEMQSIIPGTRSVCVGWTSIATVPANVTVVLGESRRVLRLTFQFDPENYAQVLDAMTEKWGDGEEEVRDPHDMSVWWAFADGASISVHQVPDTYAASSDNPRLIGLAEFALPNTTPAGDL